MSDYLSEEEQLARLRGWWERNGTYLIIGVVLVVAAVVGWRWYQNHLEERALRASDLYAEFLAADDAARQSLGDEIIAAGSGTAYPAFVLYHRAQAAVTAEDPAAAQDALRQAVALASGRELADTARLRLARVLFAADSADEALKVLNEIRAAGFLSLAAELKGDIHLSRGERALAHQSYVAARSHGSGEQQRPVLEMKIADTADTSDS
ncbi:MAG: tetratricopeptide repeat protein [Gammaproteobacteria bacterium]|nr:tetratricopeptide repeat protein [Gammaproteobacteria bacterium]